MNKLTAEKCRETIKKFKRLKEKFGGIAMESELNLQAYEIALPILEQQESVKKVSLREGIEAMRKSIADCGGYDFEALSEQQERGDGWVEWGGGKRPVISGKQVEVKFRGGEGCIALSGELDWRDTESCGDIIAYRIIPEQPTNQNGEQ